MAKERVNQAMGDEAEIRAAVEAIWAAPGCSGAHQRFLTVVDGVIQYYARRISLCEEDRHEAISLLQNRLLEVAMPPENRRVSEHTGRTIAGYDPARVKNAFLFFYGVVKSKSLDILKSRKAAWKRQRVLFDLVDSGAAFLVTPETPRDILESRHAGIEAAAAARKPAFVGGTL